MNPLSKKIFNQICDIVYDAKNLPKTNSLTKSIKEYTSYAFYTANVYYPRVTILDLHKPAYTPARTKHGANIVILLVASVCYLEYASYQAEQEKAKALKVHRKA